MNVVNLLSYLGASLAALVISSLSAPLPHRAREANAGPSPIPAGLAEIVPTPDTTEAAPDLVRIVHLDSFGRWDPASVSLEVDGEPAPVAFSREADEVTLVHVPTQLFEPDQGHIASLTYPDVGGEKRSYRWNFRVASSARDSVNGRFSALQNGARYSADGGGRSARPGDRALDLGSRGGRMHLQDARFLNEAAESGRLSVTFWACINEAGAAAGECTAFQIGSWPRSRGMVEGVLAPRPGSGSGSPNLRRLDPDGGAIPGQGGELKSLCGAAERGQDSTADGWHFYVFTTGNGIRRVWVDGRLQAEGAGNLPLSMDILDLSIGSDARGGRALQGSMDDVAFFGSVLGEESITLLHRGQSPTALPAQDDLLACWDFNDLPMPTVFAHNAREANRDLAFHRSL